jgi:protoheme ferro-lyase
LIRYGSQYKKYKKIQKNAKKYKKIQKTQKIQKIQKIQNAKIQKEKVFFAQMTLGHQFVQDYLEKLM